MANARAVAGAGGMPGGCAGSALKRSVGGLACAGLNMRCMAGFAFLASMAGAAETPWAGAESKIELPALKLDARRARRWGEETVALPSSFARGVQAGKLPPVRKGAMPQARA